MATHQKHAKLARPTAGFFGRREWAIIGAPCGDIQAWAARLAAALAPLQAGYVDADHKAADDSADTPSYAAVYTDKINYHRFDFRGNWNAWQARSAFESCDVVLVNGNHFEAARQLVALDRRKMDSLARKAARLTQVDGFLCRPGDPQYYTPEELPESVKTALPHWRDIPMVDPTDATAVGALLHPHLRAPVLKGLILAGGQSTRMGLDKATLAYRGMPQWQYLQQLMETAGIAPYISCRADQAADFGGLPVITDTFLGLGPMGAILSALQHDPDAAWLVLACDLPMFESADLACLLSHRNPSAVATCFRQPEPVRPEEADFPEPLAAIWEPRSYAVLLRFLSQGFSCPRKVLINSDTTLLSAPDPRALLNANTPEERERALAVLTSGPKL